MRKTVTFTHEETQALYSAAEDMMRDVREQIQWYTRQGLIRHGYIKHLRLPESDTMDLHISGTPIGPETERKLLDLAKALGMEPVAVVRLLIRETEVIDGPLGAGVSISLNKRVR